jgi:hypothetical protein
MEELLIMRETAASKIFTPLSVIKARLSEFTIGDAYTM